MTSCWSSVSNLAHSTQHASGDNISSQRLALHLIPYPLFAAQSCSLTPQWKSNHSNQPQHDCRQSSGGTTEQSKHAESAARKSYNNSQIDIQCHGIHLTTWSESRNKLRGFIILHQPIRGTGNLHCIILRPWHLVQSYIWQHVVLLARSLVAKEQNTWMYIYGENSQASQPVIDCSQHAGRSNVVQCCAHPCHVDHALRRLETMQPHWLNGKSIEHATGRKHTKTSLLLQIRTLHELKCH